MTRGLTRGLRRSRRSRRSGRSGFRLKNKTIQFCCLKLKIRKVLVVWVVLEVLQVLNVLSVLEFREVRSSSSRKSGRSRRSGFRLKKKQLKFFAIKLMVRYVLGVWVVLKVLDVLNVLKFR